MRKEYDFSKGVRGKFYQKGVQFQMPIYLDLKLQSRLEALARKKNSNVSDLVNGLVRKEVDLIQEFL